MSNVINREATTNPQEDYLNGVNQHEALGGEGGLQAATIRKKTNIEFVNSQTCL